jgi:membrane protease YdiL (CAAX protease family)
VKGASRPSFGDVLELALAFVVAFGAVVLVNTPSYRYVSVALAVYLGLLVGAPALLVRLRKQDVLATFGLRGVTSFPWWSFALALLLPLPFILLLWTPSLAPTVAFAVVVAPFCEEFFFRGYVAGRLRGLGVVTASVVSAVLFGAFHLGALQFHDPAYVLVLVVLGLVYAPLFLLTDSVYVTASAHAAWNLFIYLITLFPSTALGYFFYAALGVLMMANLFLALLEIMHAQRRAALPEE